MKDEIFNSYKNNALKKGYREPGIYSELYTIDDKKDIIYCFEENSIQEVALLMAKHQIGSLVICNKNKLPIGIVTDKDLTVKVVAGEIGKNENITKIMSSPVICVKPSLTIAELHILMIKNKVNHLVVTVDGTVRTKLLGIISEHDLVVQQAVNPSMLIKEIRKSNSSHQLKPIMDKVELLIRKYMEQDVSITFITQIVSEINDEIIQKAIQITENKLGRKYFENIEYCWLTLGSEGREEQLLRTDQDSAMIYKPNPEMKDIKERCLLLAKEVTGILNDIGFEYCDADVMASNPNWCQSIYEWKNTITTWIAQPGKEEILMCNIFFDFRSVYGAENLSIELKEHISSELKQDEIFVHFLAKNALENPHPLSFFKNFILEKDGDHMGSFDINLRAMMPLADSARLLIVSKNIYSENNTVKRFLKLAKEEKINSELFILASDAYKILIRIRTRQGFLHDDSGRYIIPEKLCKMDRLLLRNALQSIGDVQKLIKIRFQ